MGYENESVQPCWICKKVWKRGDVDKWYYYNGILVCRHHPGVEEWYRGAQVMCLERLKILMVEGE